MKGLHYLAAQSMLKGEGARTHPVALISRHAADNPRDLRRTLISDQLYAEADYPVYRLLPFTPRHGAEQRRIRALRRPQRMSYAVLWSIAALFRPVATVVFIQGPLSWYRSYDSGTFDGE